MHKVFKNDDGSSKINYYEKICIYFYFNGVDT